MTAVALTASAEAGSRKKLRVGLVFQSTNVNDLYQQGAFHGLERAVRNLGIQAKTVVPGPNGSYSTAFSYLARQRYDLIIALGFLETADLDIAARTFPSIKFALIDSSWRGLRHRPRNVRGALFETNQAAYLAGYLAGLLERRRPGRHVIGSIGGYKIPTVDIFVAGFEAGARKADPGIKVLRGYANDFLNPSRCRALAQQQIAAGAGAIFDVASDCGLGALAAAKENHVWGIGVDVDQSALGPHILTSVVKGLDVAVFDTIKSFRDGRFRTGSDAIFDLANHGVGLGKISPKVPPAFLRRLDRIRAEIVAGKIKVPSTVSAR